MSDSLKTEIEKLQCPFCRSDRVGIHFKSSGVKSGYQCECLNCGVRQGGSFYDSKESAASVWNRWLYGNLSEIDICSGCGRKITAINLTQDEADALLRGVQIEQSQKNGSLG